MTAPPSDLTAAPERTARLLLRRPEATHADFMVRLLNDPDWLRNIGDRGIRTRAQAEAYIRDRVLSSYETFGFGMFVVQQLDTQAPVGLCGLVKRASLPHPDLGFALLPESRGSGFAFEAAQAVMRHAADLGLTRLLAIARPDNAPSIRLLERLGFEREGSYRTEGESEDLALLSTALPAQGSKARANRIQTSGQTSDG